MNKLKYIAFILSFVFVSNPSFAFTDNLNKAKKELTCSKLKIIRNSLDLYKLDNFKYPSTEEGLAALFQKNILAEKSFLNDIWETPYIYQNIDMEISLKSLGPDKKDGTADDISLKKCSTK